MLKETIKNKEARRIFGKKEIEIILKQLNGIALTQSEKNRLSRDIRPKLEFIEKLSMNKEEFKLKKNAENKKLIEKAVDIISEDELKDKINAILLFGSHAKGEATKKSDIDICILFSDISIEEATKFRIRVSGELPEKLDIQVFNILPQKIKRSIALNHKVLLKKEGFDNLSFTINILKDEDYFIRIEKIMGESA